MNLKEITDASTAVFFFRKYSHLGRKIEYIYRDSQLYRFWQKTKIYFRYSFLERCIGIEQSHPEILDESRVIQYFTDYYKRCKNRIIGYLSGSIIFDLIKDIRAQIVLSPLKIISIVTIVAIDVDVILSFILHKPISLWGWLLRGLFFLIAISGTYCEAGWMTVRQGSALLRKIKI